MGIKVNENEIFILYKDSVIFEAVEVFLNFFMEFIVAITHFEFENFETRQDIFLGFIYYCGEDLLITWETHFELHLVLSDFYVISIVVHEAKAF